LILTFLILFVIASPLIGLAIGAAVFGWKKDAIPHYLTMGMANVMGIIGLIVVAILMKEYAGFSSRKVFSFVVLFSIAFFAFVLAILGILFLTVSF
ncbi:MAG: hypothetical protein ACE5QW_07810, partial [Thermoplasmata archaeon]